MPPECCTAQERATLQSAYDTAAALAASVNTQYQSALDDCNALATLYATAVSDRDTYLFLLNACIANSCLPALAEPGGAEPEKSFTDPSRLADLDGSVQSVHAKFKELMLKRTTIGGA